MASLIPQNFIDDLLDRTDIVELIDTRISLRKTGRNYSGLCPFHQEKTPSFSVNPDKQFYYCFGCGAGGNAIGFLMEHDRLDFRAAVEDLAKKAGVQIPEEAAPANPEAQKKKNSLYQQLEKAQNYYQQQLREHAQRDKAVKYLKQRGLTGEIAKAFGIGYAPPGWDNLGTALIHSDEDKQQLVESGMLIKKDEAPKANQRDTYDRFRDRVIFPIRDSRGRVIAFGGRVLGDDKPKYLNSPESPVFSKGRELYGLYEARQASNRLTRFIIVEGYMDVVALAQNEIFNAVATLGTATSADHLKKLFRTVSEIVFCFDGDRAGMQAAERALDSALPIMTDGRQIRFMFLPQGDDPDTLVRREGKDSFNSRIEDSVPLSDFFFDTLRQQVNIDTLDGKARFSKLALKKLQPMPDGVLRQLMLDQLANLSSLSLDRLLAFSPEQEAPPLDSYHDEDRGYIPEPDTQAPSRRQRQPSKQARRNVRSPAEQATLILLHCPQLIEVVESSLISSNTEVPGIETLLELVAFLRNNPSQNSASIIGHFQAAPDQSKKNEIVSLAATVLPVNDPAKLKAELLDALKLIADHHQESSLDHLLTKARNEPLSEEDKRNLETLLAQKHKLSN